MATLKEMLGDWPVIEPKDKPDYTNPIRPTNKWIIASGGSLFKKFFFVDNDERNRFLFALLEYEVLKGHSAEMKVKDREVMIAVLTKDLDMVTELDKEYAAEADLIYKDVIQT